MQSSTIIDLGRFSLSYGDGKRLDLPVSIGPVELGGQTYLLSPESTQVRLDISRPAHGYAFRMRFPIRVDGPCMRCLEQAGVTAEVDAREVDQRDTDDEELHSPYVDGHGTSSTSDAGRTTRRSSPCRRGSSAAPTAPASARSAASRSTTPTPPSTNTTRAPTPLGSSSS